MTIIKKRKYIGEILRDSGLITDAQLKEVIETGKRTNTRIGKVLVSMGYATEEMVARALGEQYQMPSVMLSKTRIDPQIIRLVPEATARKHMVMPVAMEGERLSVAMVDPLNIVALDDLKRITRREIRPLVATETEMLKAIGQYYGGSPFDEAPSSATEPAAEPSQAADEEAQGTERQERVAGETSVVQLVNSILSKAVTDSASDIHIEPDDGILRIRMRIDGLLQETATFPIKLHAAILSRIKIMGDLDIAEKRLPQDGRFIVKVDGREVDMRLSTLPTIFGEKAVLRLLDKSRMVLDFDHLTPFPDTIEVLTKVVRRPYGMVLITGPTGSGKTTTAYTLLNAVNTIDKNIVTVEDPVEYHFKRINQVPVNAKVGITFANALRHILRQDPDIIMIGEVRDKETAEIAIHAALTGHMVISTLHTNDAIGTISRLLDMGIEPYLVSSAVSCIAGQRLVKRICPHCKVSYDADPRILDDLGVRFPGGKAPKFYKGNGCNVCRGTGLKGRIGIYEVFVLDDETRFLINSKASAGAILDSARKRGFKQIRINGIRAALGGYTTVEEVLQATQNIQD